MNGIVAVIDATCSPRVDLQLIRWNAAPVYIEEVLRFQRPESLKILRPPFRTAEVAYNYKHLFHI